MTKTEQVHAIIETLEGISKTSSLVLRWQAIRETEQKAGRITDSGVHASDNHRALLPGQPPPEIPEEAVNVRLEVRGISQSADPDKEAIEAVQAECDRLGLEPASITARGQEKGPVNGYELTLVLWESTTGRSPFHASAFKLRAERRLGEILKTEPPLSATSASTSGPAAGHRKC